VIILIEGVILLVVDNHVVQDNASMHDQFKSVPRVRPEHSLYFFSKLITSQRRISASLVEEETHPSLTPVRRDIYHQRDSVTYDTYSHVKDTSGVCHFINSNYIDKTR
jgi:hypothetical protein